MVEPEILEQEKSEQVVAENQGKRIVEGGNLTTYEIDKSIVSQGASASIQALLQDDSLEEIVYNGPRQPVRVYHKTHGFCDTNIFLTEPEVRQWMLGVAQLNRKLLSEQSPFLDGTLEDGSRINITIPPASPEYSTFTIRKFKHTLITILDLIRSGLMDVKTAAFLWCAIEGLGYKPANLLVVGGTGCGKTTVLNALTLFIPVGQRIVTIEDTAELQLLHMNKIKMVTKQEQRITMDALLKNTLRMRPDRILVGEVRGSEALTLFEAMNTGHSGCMGTLHAETARDALTRVTSPPMSVPENMVSALDLIIVLKRIASPEGDVRVVHEITEVTQTRQWNTLFSYDPKSGALKSTGIPSRLRSRLAQAAGLTPKDVDMIIQDRANLLTELLTKEGLTPWYVFQSFDSLRYHWKESVEESHKSLIARVFRRFL